MKKYLCTSLVLIFVSSIGFAAENNNNAWYPSSDIPNIYLVELYTFQGLPQNTNPERRINILVNHGYAVGYSEELKVPLYAVYRYGNLLEISEKITERSFERPQKFEIDLRTKSRVHHDDYTGSGFDRGHMAPNYGLRSQYGHLAQLETFLMTNIAPQKAALNRYIWAGAEKKIVNQLAQEDIGNIRDLWIISGPIFEGNIKFFGNSKIAIPTGFFKIIVRQKYYWDSSVQAIALYYPQEPKVGEDKEQFVSIDFIEEKTGLDFYPNLVDKIENRMEKEVRHWNWERIYE